MKDIGKLQNILGITVIHTGSEQIFLTQHKSIIKLINQFLLEKARGVSAPLPTHMKFSSTDCPNNEESKLKMSKIPYAEAVGSVMYLMLCTRPDLACNISLLSRLMRNLGKHHWEGIKWLLRYLVNTNQIQLSFRYQRLCGLRLCW